MVNKLSLILRLNFSAHPSFLSMSQRLLPLWVLRLLNSICCEDTVLLSVRKADASASKHLGQSDTFKDYRSMQRNSAGRFQSSIALFA